ncbi:hypothetical protein QTP88_020462 [Uroleucon formosanum]
MQLVSKEACRAGIRSGKRRSKGNWETVKLILGIKVNEGRLKSISKMFEAYFSSIKDGSLAGKQNKGSSTKESRDKTKKNVVIDKSSCR